MISLPDKAALDSTTHVTFDRCAIVLSYSQGGHGTGLPMNGKLRFFRTGPRVPYRGLRRPGADAEEANAHDPVSLPS